jgi:flagellar biosynthesis protein FlhF
MKIKRYTAASMRAALALVRAEQGADAVILSSRRSDEGIEVIAAVDYDEALFTDARQRMASAPVPEPIVAPQRTQAPSQRPSPKLIPAHFQRLTMSSPPMAAPSIAAPQRPVPAKPAQPARMDAGYGEMQRELKDLRQMVEKGLAGMTGNDKRLREPLKARVLEELSALDIAPDVAATLAALTPQSTQLANPAHIPLALLVKHLPVIDDLASVSGGIMAVVGPTGAGKTMTIAKLAARWCMRHGNGDLALVSTDSYRIGARDQLTTYARLLGVPMHAANNGQELARVLERLKTKKLILIDTAGVGPRDARLAEQLATLKQGAARARILLALPAQGEGQALEEIVQAFAPLNPVACILTKVDEAASLGAVISTTLRNRLKIAYVCDGQRVPDDMHAAHQKRVWLVQAALKLKEAKTPQRNTVPPVRHFDRAQTHA